MLEDIEARWIEATRPDPLTAFLRDAGLEDPALVAMWAEPDDDAIRAFLADVEETAADRAAIFQAPRTEETSSDDA